MRCSLGGSLLWGMIGFWLAASAGAANAEAPRVPGFERFFAESNTDAAAGGRLLISELNCRSCHPGDRAGSGPVTDKQAPVLDAVGDRVRPEWIAAYLAEPHRIKPGTTMPDVLHGLPAEEKSATIAALTHFLASTGTIQDSHVDPAGARRGRALFHDVGCVACHDPLGDDAKPLPTSATLPQLGDKYTLHSLATFLKDPLKSRPSGRMPAIGLKDEEYRDLAQFFLRDRELPANVEYTAYLGNWDSLPDFSRTRVASKGKSAGFDLTVAGRPNNFAIQFRTNVYIAKAGNYQLILGSDDGSRLWIDGEAVVDVDGVHPHQEKRVTRELKAGWHPVRVDYFQGGGEWTLAVEIEGNGLQRQPLAALASLNTSQAPEAQERAGFVVDSQLAEQGRALFVSVGCVNCHAMTYQEQKLAPQKTAKPWAELPTQGGCLAETPAAGVPGYRFTARQQQSLAAAIKAGNVATETPQQVHATLTTLNCYACHVRNDVGGVEPSRNGFFRTTQPEMGDEGRIPPTLTGVGDKLRDDWMKTLFDRGADDRQLYMQAKMPRFGSRNVGPLIAAFASLDRQPEQLPMVEFRDPEYRVLADGRHLVGGKALSCIKCHDFAKYPSQGVRAISLTTMTRRLREDWFFRYMANPQEFRPGTRMPAPWPFGQATVRDVLDANVEQQMVAVWRFLSEGDKAAIPVGLVREPIELAAENTPILYRNFIEGGGSRAIGVGYPEKLNLAWDANDMRLAMAWHGAFIDASRHWNARGVGFEPPLGDHILKLPTGRPLAALSSPNDPWPQGLAREQGFQFRGYQLDAQQRPTFRFQWEDLTVTDFIAPIVQEGRRDPQMQRTLTFSGSNTQPQRYFRLMNAKTIAATDVSNQWLIDDTWLLTIDSPVEPLRRTINNQQELLLPVTLNDGTLKIQLKYAW